MSQSDHLGIRCSSSPRATHPQIKWDRTAVELNLVCLVAHASIPALVPGNTTRLTNAEVVTPRTPRLLRRLAAAIRDRALHVGPRGPTWEDIEAAVDAEQAVLAAHIDAYFHAHPPSQALAS